MPRSVMMPVISLRGVTSKAGFRIERAVGRRAAAARRASPPARSRSSIGMLAPSGVFRSIVDSGAAT